MPNAMLRYCYGDSLYFAAVVGMTKEIETINETIEGIHMINTELQDDLRHIKTTLDNIKSTKCPSASGGSPTTPPCAGLPDGSAVPDVFDFHDTPSIGDQLELLDDATALDFVDIKVTVSR